MTQPTPPAAGKTTPGAVIPATQATRPGPTNPGLSLANPHDLALAPSRLPGWMQWLMIAGFCGLVLMSAAYGVFEFWRRSTFALGVAMLWLSVVRLTCDSSRVGVLAVRSRRFDAVFCAVVGAATAFLAASVDSLGS